MHNVHAGLSQCHRHTRATVVRAWSPSVIHMMHLAANSGHPQQMVQQHNMSKTLAVTDSMVLNLSELQLQINHWLHCHHVPPPIALQPTPTQHPQGFYPCSSSSSSSCQNQHLLGPLGQS